MSLNKKENRIIVQSVEKNINLRHVERNIKLRHIGRTGEKGEPGLGIPEGGIDGDILVKLGSEDYQTQWIQPFSFDDKHFAASFTVTDVVAVNHNLNKYPAISIMDSAGDEIEGEVDYINTNQVIVRFAHPFSGRIVCN